MEKIWIFGGILILKSKLDMIDRRIVTLIFLCEVKEAGTTQVKRSEDSSLICSFFVRTSVSNLYFEQKSKWILSSYWCPDFCKGKCHVCYIFMSIDMDLFCVTCFKNVCWKLPLKKKTDSEIWGNFSQILWLISPLRWTFLWYEFYSKLSYEFIFQATNEIKPMLPH